MRDEKAAVHVVGAGGHAKVVVATLQAAGFEVEAAWDDDPARVGGHLLGVAIRGPVASVPVGASVVIAVGSNEARKAIAGQLTGHSFVSVVHPAAVVHPSAILRQGTVVFAGAVVQPDAHIGEHVIVNTGASVDHDCILESFVHVAPGVRLAGNVSLREGSFLGIGASVVPGIEIGAWAIVGAGAVVLKPLASKVTAVGCPAREFRREQQRA